MSMLAEHKTRPSWVLNPRASDWSKDETKLGQKMLEKMGWSVGKGLGAKEQGPVEALRVSYKADVRGLGASRKKEQEYWLQQQESFQSLLTDLNGGDDQNVEVKSLEERSKTSRARVHYHKFTRGKDISRYSKKDLSCIIGSGVAAPKVIPVVNLQQKISENQPESSIGDGVVGNGDCAEHSDHNPEERSETEMELRSVKRRNTVAPCESVVEKVIPSKKKKSKTARDSTLSVLEPEQSTLDDDPSQIKIRKSNKKPVSNHETTGDSTDKVQKQPKKRSARRTNDDVENLPVEQMTPAKVDGDLSPTRNRKSKTRPIAELESKHIVANEGQKRSKRQLSNRRIKDDVENQSVELKKLANIDEGSSPTKKRNSNRNPIENPETTGDVNEGKKRSKRKTAKADDDTKNQSAGCTTPVENCEEVQDSSTKARKKKKSKNAVSLDADDTSLAPVKRRKKKFEGPLGDGVGLEDEGMKKAKMKKKEELTDVGCLESKVAKQPSKRRCAKKIGSEASKDHGLQKTEEMHASSEDDVGKRKKKKKNDIKSENVVNQDENLVLPASQETVLSSHTLLENEDAETDLGSINSQSSLINDLLGINKRNSIDHITRPEFWYKNHILSPESEDDDSSPDEESITGIPKKKKKT